MLHCIAFALQLCCPYDATDVRCLHFHRTFNNYTADQSASSVLLWQPFGCFDLFVTDYIFVLFSQNKYDDGEDEHVKPTELFVVKLLQIIV